MSKKFIIHYCTGSGGFFLTSVFAKLMNIPINPVISPVGDCHDLGSGVWKEIKGFRLAHRFDLSIGDIKFIYRTGVDLYTTHVITSDFIKNNPDIQLIQIGATPSDYPGITTLDIKKRGPIIWTREEYNKWVGVDYPPYNPNNIAESEIICQDLFNSFAEATPQWFNEYSNINYSHVIQFKTVMGLNDISLVDTVAEITGGKPSDDIYQFVKEYQELNKKLYFSK